MFDLSLWLSQRHWPVVVVHVLIHVFPTSVRRELIYHNLIMFLFLASDCFSHFGFSVLNFGNVALHDLNASFGDRVREKK